MNNTIWTRMARAYPYGAACFYSAAVTRRTVRHNRRAWLRSLRVLGDKWVVLS